MKTIYKWNNCWNEQDIANDYFTDVCNDVGLDYASIKSLFKEPINIERLVLLSIGFISNEEHINPKKLKSFRIENNMNEAVKRYTFSQHPDIDAKQFRKDGLIKFGRLTNLILKEPSYFPENIKDLVNNHKVKYAPEELSNGYYFNIYSLDKETPATLIFLGYDSDINAKKIFDNISNLLINSKSDHRLVVWYETTTGIKCYCKKTKPNITEVDALKRNSYRKGK